MTRLDGGRLAANLMHFARLLRAAGLPVGPGRQLAALEAARAVGLARRDDFYWALHAVFVNRHEQSALFDQAFRLFWRNPRLLERALGLLLPAIKIAPENGTELIRRLAEAIGETRADRPDRPAEDRIEVDAALTFSAQEVLRKTDFEQMSAAELAAARAAIKRLRLPLLQVRTRRFRPDPRGARVDLRATLRAGLRQGGGTIWLRRRAPRLQHPPLVILCDISGSMGRYSRIFLHFMHAVTNERERVHTFLFGTRLTNITRHLRHRDVDVAVDRATGAVEDWSGGTRIGATIAAFNRRWSRRVLGQGAVVLLISDGLDRDGGAGLASAMERLQKSCRRLIWLNPLLRWPGFAPKPLGMRAILPHVDELRPVHNLESLAQLTEALSRPAGRRLEAQAQWAERAA